DLLTTSSYSPAPVTSEYSTLSLHDALPISAVFFAELQHLARPDAHPVSQRLGDRHLPLFGHNGFHTSIGRILTNQFDLLRMERRSEEHTSELQSRENLVCRLLLEKKNKETA